MIQTVQRTERSVQIRRDVDVPLINWWLYFLLLSWITFGIFSLYLFFKRIIRVDKFIVRKREYYDGVLQYVEKYAQEKNKYEEQRGQIEDLKALYQSGFVGTIKEIKAGLSFILCIVTFGIWGIYVWYRLNRVWNDLQNFEQEFDDKLSQILIKLELTKYPLSFKTDPSKNRSFILYIILSILTLGIWGLVWDYKIHTDPDNLYKEFHAVEDTVLQMVRK